LFGWLLPGPRRRRLSVRAGSLELTSRASRMHIVNVSASGGSDS
jgi:hypothetical protein